MACVYMVCRSNQAHPFEVHTQERVFYLSANTADEMQSWVGMLQTLKQYRKTRTLYRGVVKGVSENATTSITTNNNIMYVLMTILHTVFP